MRTFLLIAGIILVFLSVLTLGQYIMDYQVLSEYGKGYVWGKIILFCAGALLIYLSLRKSGTRK